ncbi:asparaginase [Candidatus Uhrbacteria bacterium]|nr:asparaginase [Candidatus Uhrbacteria bacterium]
MKTEKKDTIYFILTGGTIDSFYDGTRDTAVTNKHSVIPDYIKSLRLYEKLNFAEVCMKDSRSLTTSDRAKIVQAIQKSASDKIIITHGTYTMPDTARYLKAHLDRAGGRKRTIVFTGAMIPLVGFTPSDGPFNLGYALAQVRTLQSGIYVCMNGKVFSPDEVVKELYKGRFASIFTK